MGTSQQPATFSDTDIAWAAGFVDGEGCIALVGRSQVIKGITYKCFVLRLTVANTDLRTLIRLKGMFNGSVYAQNHKNRPQNKPCWVWNCAAANAEVALRTMLPYLLSKKEQAEVGILSRQHIQPNRARRKPGALEAQEKIYGQLRLMKKT